MKFRSLYHGPMNSMLAAMLAGLTLLVFAAPAQSQDLRQTARKLVADYGSAIVNVQIVLSLQFSMGGQNSPENEVKAETSGTVIGSDGLTIVPLSAVDPAQLYKRFMSNSDRNVNSRVKDIKLIVNKRTEIPATVVLRDTDLNIAFLRPVKKPAAPMKAFSLADAAEVQLLDEAVVLSRLGKVGDREISVMTGEIQSIVTKPRKFYVPASELASGGFGVPAFTADGRILGIVLMRTAPGGMEESGAPGMGEGGMLGIILPIKDIKEVADQAPQEAAPSPETKTKPATQAPKDGAPAKPPVGPVK